MNGIACKHITHNEIERYVNTDEERFFQGDLTFFEEFDERLDNCEVCAERFRVYNFISAMIGEESLEGSTVTITLIERFIVYIRQKTGEIGGIIEDFLNGITFAMWDPIPAVSRNVTRGVSEDQAKTIDIEEIRVEKNGSFYKFTVSEQNRMKIMLPQNLDSNQKYKLYLQRIADGKNFEYHVEKTRQGGLAVVTDELYTGEYLATVVRLNQGD